HVAVGVLERDDDHVGRDVRYAPGDADDVVHDRQAAVAGIAKPCLDDGGAQAILVDDQDRKRCRLRRHAGVSRSWTENGCPSAGARFSMQACAVEREALGLIKAAPPPRDGEARTGFAYCPTAIWSRRRVISRDRAR